MNTENILKNFEDIEKITEIERYLLDKSNRCRKLEVNNKFFKTINQLMECYNYGWYIYEDNFIEQLKELNKFKLYIIKIAGAEIN